MVDMFYATFRGLVIKCVLSYFFVTVPKMNPPWVFFSICGQPLLSSSFPAKYPFSKPPDHLCRKYDVVKSFKPLGI